MIELSQSKEIDITKIQRLRESVGWGARTIDQWTLSLERSTCVVTAWDGDEMVGMGRVVDDGVMAMFYDLVVDPRYQAKGVGLKIGRALIDYVKDKNFTQIGLFADTTDPRLQEGYKRMGFVMSTSGMELAEYQTVPVA